MQTIVYTDDYVPPEERSKRPTPITGLQVCAVCACVLCSPTFPAREWIVRRLAAFSFTAHPVLDRFLCDALVNV